MTTKETNPLIREFRQIILNLILVDKNHPLSSMQDRFLKFEDEIRKVCLENQELKQQLETHHENIAKFFT